MDGDFDAFLDGSAEGPASDAPFRVQPTAAGFDGGPTVTFDASATRPLLTAGGPEGQGGFVASLNWGTSVARQWLLPAGEVAQLSPSSAPTVLAPAVDCTDDQCEHAIFPGPNGTLIYAPWIERGQASRFVWVVDHEGAAAGAWLDDSITAVLGTRLDELVCLRTVDGHTTVVTIGLAPLLDQLR